MKKNNNTHTGYRDSKNGQFITQKQAEKHKNTSQKESVPNPGRGDTGKGKHK